MKNNEPVRGFSFHHLKKTLLIMRIAIILLLVGFFQTRANDAYSQKTRLSVNFSNTELVTILDKIENQSEFYFLYNEKLIDGSRKVSIDVKDQSLEDILKSLFAGTEVKYMILDRKIILSPDEIIPSQQAGKKVTGNVKDVNGQPIPGASVIIKGSTNGTVTDFSGNFSLSDIPAEATLKISFVGMKSQEVSVANKTTITVLLSEETIGLNEVVAIGYGTTRKKDLTGAVAVVSAKEFDGRENSQFGNALEGKIAGVQISKPSGQPQAGYNIRIRGTSTITAGSEPLYIVDGVPTSSINEISSADIETMTILKDASSAAIYGASGSNGVVLITTKRGGNEKTKITVNAYNGLANVWKKQNVLDATQYKSLMSEMGQSVDWSLYPYNTNWQDKAFRTARTQNYQIGISGGNEKTNYYISGSYLNQEGVVITNKLERYNFKVNLDHKVSERIKVGTSVSYNKWKDIDVNENRKYGSIVAMLTGAPVTDIYNADGTTFAINPFIQDLENPVALLLKNKHSYQNYRFNGNFYGEVKIVEGLKFKSMFGVEQLNSTYNSWVDPVRSREGRGFKGIAELSTAQTSYWISENTLSYNKVINKHTFNGLAGFVASDKKYESIYINAKGFGSSAVETVNAGATRTADAGVSQRRNSAALGRLNYAYDDKYLLTANFRADGSSVFGANHKWGYFPSFSAGWRISNESFFKGIDVVKDLKLRAGWGIVGNDQVGDFSSYGLVSPGSFYVFSGNVVPGTSATSIQNNDLKWESTKQTNLGVDASILDSRISVSADYYIKNTSDMLLNSPIPASVGIPSNTATKNVGEMENKGFEFQISSKNLTGDLKWNTDFNISFNKSKITHLDKGVPIKLGYISDRGNVAIAQEGQPLGMFFGYVSKGVDPQTGNLIFADLDHTGTLSDGDQTIIGNANPKYTFGLNNTLNYGNWTFSVFVQGVQGNQIFNATRIESEGLFDEGNQLTSVLNRWKTAGQITNMPKADYGINHNSLISSRYIEDGSFVRIKSATLGYELPKRISDKLNLNKLYLYVTAENLFTFTKYSGMDPEVSVYGRTSDNALKNIAPGVDYGTYPQARSFLVGINLTF